jgi:hypothetical protein
MQMQKQKCMCLNASELSYDLSLDAVAIKHTKQISMKQKENTESLGVNI